MLTTESNSWKDFFSTLKTVFILFVALWFIGLLVYFTIILPLKAIVWIMTGMKADPMRVLVPHCGNISLIGIGAADVVIFGNYYIGVVKSDFDRPVVMWWAFAILVMFFIWMFIGGVVRDIRLN